MTLTLGGSPSTALLQASSLTLGWTGTLAMSRGGTGASLTGSVGGIVWSDTSSTLAILSGVAAANRVLLSGNTATPAWSTATYPSTATSTGTILRANGTNWLVSTSTFADTYSASTILYASGANTVSGLGTANYGVLITNGSGVPSWLAAGTTGKFLIATSTATPSWSTYTLSLGGNLSTAAAVSFTGAFTFSGAVTAATSITFPISGLLATTSQLPTPAALTIGNDTNVTLTLGGSASTALLNAASVTAGWTGTLAMSRGGSGANISPALGCIIYTNGSNMLALAAGTSGQVLKSNGGAAPSWVTPSSTWVSGITGTADQIVASGSIGDVTLSLAPTVILDLLDFNNFTTQAKPGATGTNYFKLGSFRIYYGQTSSIGTSGTPWASGSIAFTGVTVVIPFCTGNEASTANSFQFTIAATVGTNTFSVTVYSQGARAMTVSWLAIAY